MVRYISKISVVHYIMSNHTVKTSTCYHFFMLKTSQPSTKFKSIDNLSMPFKLLVKLPQALTLTTSPYSDMHTFVSFDIHIISTKYVQIYKLWHSQGPHTFATFKTTHIVVENLQASTFTFQNMVVQGIDNIEDNKNQGLRCMQFFQNSKHWF
jgi:hypothetical protein